MKKSSYFRMDNAKKGNYGTLKKVDMNTRLDFPTDTQQKQVATDESPVTARPQKKIRDNAGNSRRGWKSGDAYIINQLGKGFANR